MIILSNSSNFRNFQKYQNISFYHIKDYSDSANYFANYYKYMLPQSMVIGNGSDSHYTYELRCIQRWFIIKDFMKYHNLEKVKILLSYYVIHYNFLLN